jgi:hypothetical protein
MLIETNPYEEFTQGLSPYTSLETEDVKDRDHQADEPCAPLVGFPKPGLRVMISA